MKRMLAGSVLAGCLSAGASAAVDNPLEVSFVPNVDDGLEQLAHARIRGWSTGWEAGTGVEVGIPGHASASWNWSSAIGAQDFVWEVADGVSTLTINGRAVIEDGITSNATDLFVQLRATDYSGFEGVLNATGLTLVVDDSLQEELPDLSADNGWSGLLRVSGLPSGTSFRLSGTLLGNFHEIKEERIKIDMRLYENPAAPGVPEPASLVLSSLGFGFLLLRRGS